MLAQRCHAIWEGTGIVLKDLNWRPLDQRHIDSRFLMMYKVSYDLVAIPAPEYLVQNTRQPRHIHSLSYRQIHTLKDYYRFTFSLELSSTGTPSLPIYQFSIPWLSIATLSTRQSMCLPKYRRLILSCIYTSTSTRTVQTHFTHYSFTFTSGVKT